MRSGACRWQSSTEFQRHCSGRYKAEAARHLATIKVLLLLLLLLLLLILQ
jgi:hypothetical protein